jgi:hypothetical protein
MKRPIKSMNPDAAPLTVTDAGRNRYGLDATEERYAQLRAQGMHPKAIFAHLGMGNKIPGIFEGKNPKLVARIAMLQDEAAGQVVEKIRIDKEVIARETWDMYQNCKPLNTIVDKEGNTITAPVKANEALKALELLAKLEGLLVQKSEIRTGSLDGLSDAELTRIAVAIAAEIGLDSGLVGIEAPAGPEQT